MPIDIAITLLIKGKDVIVLILDRLDQMKSSSTVAKRIKETLEYLQSIIKNIEQRITIIPKKLSSFLLI